MRVEKAIADKLNKAKNAEIVSIWGSTLHHIDDLPYNPKEHIPHVYGRFRDKNSEVKVRPMVPEPQKGDLPPMKAVTNS